jgi:carbon storage regulator
MLVLARHPGEVIRIGSEIRIVITGVRGSRILVGIDAPRNIIVDREEIYLRKYPDFGPTAPSADSLSTSPKSEALASLAGRFRVRADACACESREAVHEREMVQLAAMASTLEWTATELDLVARCHTSQKGSAEK